MTWVLVVRFKTQHTYIIEIKVESWKLIFFLVIEETVLIRRGLYIVNLCVWNWTQSGTHTNTLHIIIYTISSAQDQFFFKMHYLLLYIVQNFKRFWKKTQHHVIVAIGLVPAYTIIVAMQLVQKVYENSLLQTELLILDKNAPVWKARNIV